MYANLRNRAGRIDVSFAALHRYLDQPGVSWRIAALLVTVHTGLLVYSGYVHSPTLNEPAHLVAGLSHWKFRRFDLYRVNPPLVRMAAALPVVAVGYEEDWSGYFEGPGARPVFGMGEGFVAANGTRSFFLFIIARWACIPFSWLGAIACYLWARDLAGKPAGLMACLLWCFSPNILGHASLITADVGGTALGVAACYTFWRWLKKPTWTQAALTGGMLGLAELAKTTLILFYAIWPLLWIAYRWTDRQQMRTKEWLREAGMLLVRMVVGIYVLNLGYGFEGSLTRLEDFEFVSDLLTTSDSREVDNARPLSTNRFRNRLVGALPIPFPKNYVLGLDIQQGDFESYSWPSYLRGKWQDHGWRHYYIYAASIKTPLGVLMLGCIAIARRILISKSSPAGRMARDWIILLTPPIVIFLVVSAKNGFSEHFRYVLPCFPFAYIFLSSALYSPLSSISDAKSNAGRANRVLLTNRAIHFTRPVVLAVLLLWSVGSSLSIYPHSLSYFNEIIGGPRNGPDHLLGSNVDWGQDLPYLADAVAALPADLRADVAFHGSVPPSLLLPEQFQRAEGILRTTSEEDVEIKGWLAYSVNACYPEPKMLLGKTTEEVGPLARAACKAHGRSQWITYSVRCVDFYGGDP